MVVGDVSCSFDLNNDLRSTTPCHAQELVAFLTAQAEGAAADDDAVYNGAVSPAKSLSPAKAARDASQPLLDAHTAAAAAEG